MSDDWSHLAEEAREATQPRGPECRVGRMLSKMDPTARKAVQAALDNPEITTVGLARAMRNRLGKNAPSIWSFGNHRRQQCRCWLDEA